MEISLALSGLKSRKSLFLPLQGNGIEERIALVLFWVSLLKYWQALMKLSLRIWAFCSEERWMKTEAPNFYRMEIHSSSKWRQGNMACYLHTT